MRGKRSFSTKQWSSRPRICFSRYTTVVTIVPVIVSEILWQNFSRSFAPKTRGEFTQNIPIMGKPTVETLVCWLVPVIEEAISI
jgi:hypothetical protein